MINTKSRGFLIVYLIFLVSMLLLGSVSMGPLTIRNIMTVIMFFYCFTEGYYKLDRYFALYLCFIFFFIVSSAVSGDFGNALKKTLSYYFVCYVTYQATKCVILKYGAGDIIVKTLLYIGIIDAIVTIGQFFGNPLAYAMFEAIKPKGISGDMLEYFSTSGTLIGVVIPGLVGGVANGYLLSGVCALAFYDKNSEIKLRNIALVLFLLAALFMVQERSGIVAGVLIVAMLFVKYLRYRFNLYVLLLFVLALFFISPVVVDFLLAEQSKFVNFDHSIEQRLGFVGQTFDFLRENPWGSIYEYGRTHEFPPHNVFLNSFIYAGVLGAPFIIVLIIIQFVQIIPIFFKKLTTNSQQILLFGCVYITYTLNSMFHNASLVTGDPMFWISWAFVACHVQQERRNSLNQIQR